ncbi:MAG: hypothetical protein AUH94_06565 [Ktedonobacter sp. 13_2_20CM_2_54_8]|nr:MAG: hypothetical protein AUH94_06565 [Ktedonobacter sp. 13_2_20CM_2_54_8]
MARNGISLLFIGAFQIQSRKHNVALSFVQKEEMQSFLSPVLDNEFSQTHPHSGTSTQGR